MKKYLVTLKQHISVIVAAENEEQLVDWLRLKTPDEVELIKLRLKGYDIDKKEALIIMDKDNPLNKPIMINEHKEKMRFLKSDRIH